MSEVVDFCRRLVRTKSFSGSEGPVARLIAEEMEGLGFDRVELDAVGNVVGLIRGSGGTIVFDGHMDTVGAGSEGWRVDPFSAEVIDDSVVGRGAVDMKGAIAAMVHSASELGEVENTVYYVFVVHEEDQEGFGIRHFLKEREIRPDLVVIGEPTGLSIAVGHRGRAELVIRSTGRTSHSSMPDLGVNALLKMCGALMRLEGCAKSLPVHPRLGRATIAPVSIACSPGEVPVIPDECEAVLDRRIVPGETREGVIAHLESLLPGIEASIRTKELRCYTGYEEHVEAYFPPWYQETELSKGIAEELGAELMTWRFGTDGSYTAGEEGLTTVGYGPGHEEMAHSPNEALELKQLLKSVDGYARIAEMDVLGAEI